MKIFTDEIVFGSLSHELSLGATRVNYQNHLAEYGSLPDFSDEDRRDFLSLLEKSALTGHGGAHFPVYRKLQSAMQSPTGGTIVANAAEGEPGSAKDAALWQYRPHLLIDGMLIAAQMIQARKLVIWLHENERTTQRSISAAIQERAAGNRPIDIEILVMPARYTSGENSSVISGVKGEQVTPKFRLDKARPWGVGKPAILAHNTETIARIAQVYKKGISASQFHLLTILGFDRRTVIEVESADSYGKVIPNVAGNPPILFGGFGATWMTWDTVKHLKCDPVTLRSVGLSFGAGIIAPLPNESCPIVETGRVLSWMASQSARQCGPCFQGLADVSNRWNEFSAGKLSPTEFNIMLQRIGLIPGRGGCAHPDGTIRLARSALTLFADEVENHQKSTCSYPEHLNFLPVPAEEANR